MVAEGAAVGPARHAAGQQRAADTTRRRPPPVERRASRRSAAVSAPRSRLLALGEGRPTIEVLEAGNGPALLFLHGAGGVPAWVGALPLLAERFRVVAPLLPGFGQSTGLEFLDDQ